jgi:hypothetical protein
VNVALSKIAIVASDPELAESISAHFRAPRTYVSVIETPKVRLEEYGVFERDCIHVTNAIRAQHPQLALFVSCSNKVTEKLRAHLPPIDAIDIKDFDLTEVGRLATINFGCGPTSRVLPKTKRKTKCLLS